MRVLLRTKPPKPLLPLPSQGLLASMVWSEAVNMTNMTMTSARMISISIILRWFLLRVLEGQNRPVCQTRRAYRAKTSPPFQMH